MTRILHSAVVSLVAVVASLPSARASVDPLAGLDEAIEAARVQWHAPGLAVAIVKDGKLGWDDPVIRHIPEFRVADPFVTREATVRDLLAHRTGIEQMDVLWSRGFGVDRALPQISNANQASSLRSTWAYNNVMYMVAAEVVARASGMSFEDFVTRRIFAPAGMTESLFTGPKVATRGDVVGAHMIERGVTRRTEPYRSAAPLGAAGIQSTAADMAKWLRLLLNGGSLDGRQVVKSETIAETLEPQMILPDVTYPAAKEAKPNFFAYGLGWFLQDYEGRLLAMHTGSLYGANSLVAIVPEEKLGLVILVNADPVHYRHAFMYDVIDRFIGSRGKDWNADLWQVYSKLDEKQRQQRADALAARPNGTNPSAPLSAFAAKYTNPVAGEAEVTVTKGGRLTLRMEPDAVFELSHWSFDAFEARDVRAPEEAFLLTFARDADGRVSRFETASGRIFRLTEIPVID